jgi:hypothetical protein
MSLVAARGVRCVNPVSWDMVYHSTGRSERFARVNNFHSRCWADNGLTGANAVFAFGRTR